MTEQDNILMAGLFLDIEKEASSYFNQTYDGKLTEAQVKEKLASLRTLVDSRLARLENGTCRKAGA